MPCDAFEGLRIVPMSSVRWQFARLGDWAMSSDDVSGAEWSFVNSGRDQATRQVRLLARSLARRLLEAEGFLTRTEWRNLEIRSLNEQGKGIPPELILHGRRLPISLSLSHSGDRAVAALAPSTSRVGVDLLSTCEVRPNALRIWMTAAELDWLSSEPADSWATAWAIKEAAYKCLCRDEPFSPRDFEVERTWRSWQCRPLGRVTTPRDKPLRIQVHRDQDWITAIAVAESRGRDSPQTRITLAKCDDDC